MIRRTDILLVGAGGHARACCDVIEQEGRFLVGGFVGESEEVGRVVFGYSVLGTDADLSELVRHYPNALVAIGQIKTPEPRIRLFDLLTTFGYTSPAIISPKAYVSPRATVGAGTIVMHGAVVNAGAAIGRNCIINSSSLVEHDSVIADHCHIATGAAINGRVKIGTGTFIGSGAIVRQGITIGEGCFIAMGQRVVEHCAPAERLSGSRRSL